MHIYVVRGAPGPDTWQVYCSFYLHKESGAIISLTLIKNEL